MTPKISVIVPVYNSESSLYRCVDSILSQNFKNFELLLIDDSSKDRSGKICDEYAKKDSRVKVFHKENGGVSSARNVGLDNAKGEWITFVDSDDEILNDAFLVYDRIIDENNDIDLICCGSITCYKSGSSSKISCNEFKSKDKQICLLKCEESGYYGFLWNKCFKSSIAKKYRFDETISWCEDHLYAYLNLLKCKCVYFSPNIVYKYYVDDTEFKGKGHSSMLLDYKMVIKIGNMERDLKYKFYRDDEKLKSKIEIVYTYRIMDAIYYAVISNHFLDAYKIYKKYYSGKKSFLLSFLIKNHFSPIPRFLSTIFRLKH